MSATAVFAENPEGIHHTFGSVDGPVGRSMERLTNRVVTTAKDRANVDTGLMRSRIEGTVETEDDHVIGRVTAATDYSYYVHEGTDRYEGNPFLEDALHIELAKGLA